MIELTPSQADVIYGMLTQRLYLRSDDPERETVQAAREAVYPATSAFAESIQAAAEFGGVDWTDDEQRDRAEEDFNAMLLREQ